VRSGIDGGASLDELVSAFAEFERSFADWRAPHLLPEYG
jgi:hypothetical protein